MAPTGGFSFTKWYLDGITPAGDTWIGYWTRLAWRGLAVAWHSVARSRSTPALHESSSLAAVDPPVWRAGHLVWQAPALGVTLEYQPTARSFARTLFRGPGGSVEWHCEVPAAHATCHLTTLPPLEGVGYAERIHFTIPPWRLPLRELRWGRWIAEDAAASLIWIDWLGQEPRTWVVLNGTDLPASRVSDDAVVGRGAELVMADRHLIRTRALADLVHGIPALTPLLPKKFLHLRETRWQGRGELRRAGHAPLRGLTLSEHVILG